jgi:hypothetical protein
MEGHLAGSRTIRQGQSSPAYGTPQFRCPHTFSGAFNANADKLIPYEKTTQAGEKRQKIAITSTTATSSRQERPPFPIVELRAENARLKGLPEGGG